MIDQSTSFPQSSLMELHNTWGIPLDKLVLGKPLVEGLFPAG